MESSRDTGPQEGEKVAMLLRIVPSLKRRLADYAKARGLTLNAAATVLLDQGLADAEKRPGS